MTIFGIGPFELVLILIIALIFLGPEKLPEVARALGKAIYQLQQMAEPYREELTRAIQPVQDVAEPVNSIRQQWEHPLEIAKSALSGDVPAPGEAAPQPAEPGAPAASALPAPQPDDAEAVLAEPRILPPVADQPTAGDERDNTAA